MYSKSNYYSDVLIEEVLSRINSGEISANKAREIYGIGGKMTVYKWIKRYGVELINNKGKRMTRKKKYHSKTKEDIALEEAKLRIEYYETILGMAQREFGVDFKKILAPRNIGSITSKASIGSVSSS